MEYKTFECSVMRENKIGLTQHHRIKEFNKETQGYIRKDDAKKVILRTRQRFSKALLNHKGPPIIPTVFKNHPNRFEYVRDRDKALHHLRNVRNPPELPFYLFSFADDVFLNLTCNFRQNAFRAYINHGVNTRFISLNEESCGELAFEEMLLQHPLFYSKDEAIFKKSQYIDPSVLKDTDSSEPSDKCSNTCHFIVDVSIIFSEEKVSTVWVYCVECGRLVETVLCDKTIQIVQEEILHNISRSDMKSNESDSVCVARLPLRSCIVQGCSFVEGLIGATPLTKGNPVSPSVFVRTRLFYYCNPNSKISEVVHHAKDKDITDSESIDDVVRAFQKVIIDIPS